MAAPVAVRVTRDFAAPPERVFDAWLDPDALARWMFGPNVRDEEVVRLTVDARVGGTFSFVVRRAGTEIDHLGEYLAIDRPRRLAFTWGVAGTGASSRVATDIVPRGIGCTLSLTHELHPDWADYAQRTAAGWTKMLGVLGDVLDGTARAAG